MRQVLARRRWLRSGAFAMVLAAGSATAQQASFGSAGGLQFESQPSRPSLSLALVPPLPSSIGPYAGNDIGVQWRSSGAYPVDITAWRRLPGPNPAPDALSLVQNRQPLYGARVEMKLPAARSGFVTDLKAIGLQLDNGAKIMLRRKDGNPTLYYRQQF